MTHIAMQEALDGVAVVWLEKVTDEELTSLPRALAGLHPALPSRHQQA
jgi:hypothetical protein